MNKEFFLPRVFIPIKLYIYNYNITYNITIIDLVKIYVSSKVNFFEGLIWNELLTVLLNHALRQR